ncbi:site-specific recombinase XerD [Breoghania corrubedonensis]|uniref:Site-specific recombinase XerD n=1 Tax=Breoghania corrubedonensis TaxID=665038 RepID=A0A2T5VI51_9HYPH|nr:tyrosine-type recombinase/integrase [Breoghania corrubedonensis]PTW63437.1 site-specific recombinase XerD [Breoghania corrubedonensis]
MARSSSTDRRYLELHGGKWRVTISIPRDLQRKLGTKLKHPLNTDSLAVANRLKWPVIARLKERIELERGGGLHASHIKQALVMSDSRRSAVSDVELVASDAAIIELADQILGPVVDEGTNAVTGQVEPVYNKDREKRAVEFAKVALGHATPMDRHHQQYLDQLTVKPRTRADDERAMKYLKAWCELEGVSPVLQSFTRKTAVRFMDGLSGVAQGLSPVTLNKYLRRLSRYWQWLEMRNEVEDNIWRGLTIAEPKTAYDEAERSFTDDEVRRLLQGEATQHMHDLMRIAALTGARIDPIVCLRVCDCADGVFIFKPQKKEKKERACPIHPDLAAIIERRVEGKEPEDALFPEWPAPRKKGSMRERSFKASSQFTDYRRKMGVDEVVSGKRRSLVNFHSFRRWFITKAEQADQPESIIAAVVGHKRQGMTLGRYSAGPLVDQARRCVEAVNLPCP